MHCRKFQMKSAGRLCAHFARGVKPGHYSNTDIDPERTGLNRNYGPERTDEKGRKLEQTAYIRRMLEKIPHSNRKDLVVMASVIVNVPKNLPQELYDDFFQHTYNFLVSRYGGYAMMENPEDVVISCYRHNDETTPHIHFAFLPVIGKTVTDKETGQEHVERRFCCKEVVSKSDLKTLHPDLKVYLQEHGIRADILNGKTRYDANGRALSVKQLKRESQIRKRERTRERGRF